MIVNLHLLPTIIMIAGSYGRCVTTKPGRVVFLTFGQLENSCPAKLTRQNKKNTTIVYLMCLCHQEVEPTIGEALCRLFPPDENIDLRRIAQIARQSLKRRDPSTGKATPASRSALDLSQPAPPGLTEPTSSRSDKLLLGLYDSGTVNQGRARTTETAALGWLRCAVCNYRTCFTDILALCHLQELEKTRLGRIQMDILNTARDFGSQIPLSETVQWTFKWTLLLNPAAQSCCCTNSRWGGLVDRTALLCLRGVLHCFDQLNSWSVDLLRQIPHWISRPSWTLPAFQDSWCSFSF